ncbi:MAG: amidase, partial [Propionibacteriaceae bacterium]
MPVPRPTTAEISALAAELGYTAVVDAAEEYTAIITGLLGVYDAVDTLPEPEVLAGRGPVPYRVPSAQEDPHHAWEVRTSIPGAGSGPLTGVRLGVKDSIMVAGLPMANGTDVLADFVPAGDATVVTRRHEVGQHV